MVLTYRPTFRERRARHADERRRRAYERAYQEWERDYAIVRTLHAIAGSLPTLDSGDLPPGLELGAGEQALWATGHSYLLDLHTSPPLPEPDHRHFAALPPGRPFPVPEGTVGRTRDGGAVVITDHRLIFLGGRLRREWRHDELTGLAHRPDRPCTLLRSAGRPRVSGLRLAAGKAHSFRFFLTLAIAEHQGARAAFARHLQAAVAEHQAHRPQEP